MARARAAAAAAAAAPPCGRAPVAVVSFAASRARGVQILTCPSPKVANASASGANAAPRTRGFLRLETPPPRPGARLSSYARFLVARRPPQSQTRTQCVASAATVTSRAGDAFTASASPTAPSPGPKATATTPRSPGACRSLATSLPVFVSQTHTQGALPAWPVAAHKPEGCVAMETISSSCPRKNVCVFISQSYTTPIAPTAYAKRALLPFSFVSFSSENVSDLPRVRASASRCPTPAVEHPCAHRRSTRTSGGVAETRSASASQPVGANTPTRHGAYAILPS